MDKKKKLLALLSDANHPVTGKELSSRLNVSDRTIRNYIREMNEKKPLYNQQLTAISLYHLTT